jgi:transposase
MENLSTIGIDIAKSVIQVHGASKSGRRLFSKKVNRSEFLPFMANLKPCLVGMEACGGSHHWGRELSKLGHEVKLMPPQHVKPYVKTNKNDAADAEACAEAVTRPTMRFVPVKSEAQQELAMLHRVRERLIKERTALANQIRGFFTELGMVFPQGINRLQSRVTEALKKHDERLSGMFRTMMNQLLEEFTCKETEIERYEKMLEEQSRSDEQCKRLMTIPGVGVITATAIVSTIGSMNPFSNGRHFAAFLGLVPRQHSSGGKDRLGGISKRGDGYLRKLLVQGAHAVLRHSKKLKGSRGQWLNNLILNRGRCRAAVALANKNARIIWALLTRGENYRIIRGEVSAGDDEGKVANNLGGLLCAAPLGGRSAGGTILP